LAAFTRFAGKAADAGAPLLKVDVEIQTLECVRCGQVLIVTVATDRSSGHASLAGRAVRPSSIDGRRRLIHHAEIDATGHRPRLMAVLGRGPVAPSMSPPSHLPSKIARMALAVMAKGGRRRASAITGVVSDNRRDLTSPGASCPPSLPAQTRSGVSPSANGRPIKSAWPGADVVD
jgi:hypothetical protein